MCIHFDADIQRWADTAGVHPQTMPGEAVTGAPRPVPAQTDAATFIAHPALHDEVFGPAALVVRAGSVDEAVAALRAIGGSLTSRARWRCWMHRPGCWRSRAGLAEVSAPKPLCACPPRGCSAALGRPGGG